MATAAGSQISSVYVRIGADTSGLDRGIARAGAQVRNFANVAKIAATAVAGFAAAAAGVGAAYLAIYKSGANSIDQMSKFADQVGISTEALGGLRYAAQEMAGVGNKDFDLALRRMTRRIAEAAAGTGAAQTALKNLGLNAQELARLAPDQQFRRIADAMQGMGNQGQRLRAAFSIFDTGGAPLLNALKEGSEGLDKMQAEAERLGLAINKLDAAKVVAANDAFARFGNIVEGIRNQITVALAPLITELASRFQTGAIEAKRFGDFAVTAMKAVAYATAVVMDTVHSLKIALSGLSALGAAIGNVLVGSFKAVYDSIAKVIDGVTTGINTIIDGANKVSPVEIPLIPKVQESGISKAIDDIANKAEYAATQARYEFGNLLTEKSAVSQVDDFFAAAEKRAQELADTITVLPDVQGGDLPGDGKAKAGKASKERENYIKQLNDRVELLRKSLLTEQQVELEAFYEKEELLGKAREEGLKTDEELRQMELDVRQQFQDSMTEIDRKATEDRIRQAQKEAADRQSVMSGMLSNLASLMNSGSRKMFQIGKVAAVAEALVKGYQAVVNSYEVGTKIGGPAVGAAFAATAAAATAAQIASIKNVQFGGGGSPSAGYSKPSDAVSQGPVSAGGATQNQVVSINLEGEMFGQKQVRDLIGKINEAISDGARIQLA